MNRDKMSLWKKIRAYKLTSNVGVLFVLGVFMVISLVVYYKTPEEQTIVKDLSLAFATSLLASIFCLASETYVRFRTYENDKYLEGIEALGISDLHFDKQKLLINLLSDCTQELWISGYRLILTGKVAKDLTDAAARNIKIKILITPPWEPAFEMVYGECQRVIDNYIIVFDAIKRGSPNVCDLCEVRFTHKPLFNDTYKVDNHLITGPYMHNKDEINKRITASDFFTYELSRKSRLYNLIEGEYNTIWNEADCKLDWEQYEINRSDFDRIDLTEKERIEALKRLVIPV